MQRVEISEDESGTIRTDLFFSVGPGSVEKPKEAHSRLRKSDGGRRAGVFCSEGKEMSRCPKNPKHRTYKTEVTVFIDLFGGSSDIVEPEGPWLLVVESLLEKFKQSKLTGWKSYPCVIEHREDSEDKTKVFSIEGSGPPMYRREVFGPGFTNRCLNCGHGPVFCSECDEEEFHTCPRCKFRCVEWGFADDDRIKNRKTPFYWVKPTPEKGFVLDASKWDGNDFNISLGGVVTSRVIKALLEWGAWPFTAYPVRTFVDTCSKEQLAALDKIRYR